MHTTAPAPLQELRNYLVGLADEFRGQRHFAGLLEVETVRDIARDDSKRLGIAGKLLIAAEHEDLTAADLIRKVLSDGCVDESEVGVLRNALVLIERSAIKDHEAAGLVAI
jgi:hypothetical protein